MTDKKDIAARGASSSGAMIDSFLDAARRLEQPAHGPERPRLVFALDATMSRQPTWDLACRLQGEMFGAASGTGLAVQLVYFRGFNECRASRFVVDARTLTDLMASIGCRGGHTQIARILRHVRAEAGRGPLKVLVYVGDAMEEPVDDLCAVAGELGLLGVKAFMFHEGGEPVAACAFKEVARLTGGAYARFDAGAPEALAGLLRAAAVYAAEGAAGLTRLAAGDGAAHRLLASLSGRSA
jgi:hypothetical protein